MIILDSRRPVSAESQQGAPSAGESGEIQAPGASSSAVAQPAVSKSRVKKEEEKTDASKPASEDINPDDIPF